MAEGVATIPNLPIASTEAQFADQLNESATESDLLRNAPKIDMTRLLYILDDTGNVYPVPWEQGREYSRFKLIVQEIYTRKGDEEKSNRVHSDKFNVTYDIGGGFHVILPSLWNDFVQEGLTVRISFFSESRSCSPEILRPISPEVGFVDVDDDAPHDDNDEMASGSESSIQSGESDGEESETASERDEEVLEDPPAEPVRAVIEPLDEEGSPLSYGIDTRWAAKWLSTSKENNSSKDSSTKKAVQGRDMVIESLKITKAITSVVENRTSLEVYTLPGPENHALSSSVAIRWHHLHGKTLDWGRFKDTCLTLPDLSERTRFLIVQTLRKIEKEHIKAFLGGLFIEPGTILRGDECHQPDPDHVIFSCTPYFNIQKGSTTGTQGGLLHPARTLIQSYYPYEPVRERDEEQAYQKSGTAKPDEIIYVPSLWMLNVSGKAVVTCGYEPLSNDFTKSIKVLEEDLKQLGADLENTSTSIRLSGVNGRVLLYSLQECGTYFQFEQRIRELRRFDMTAWYMGTPQVLLQRQGEKVKATASNWSAIIRQRNNVFVDVSLVEEIKEETSSTLSSILESTSKQSSVLPFYHWPSALNKEDKGLASLPMDVRHAIKCLELVERAMLNDILPEDNTSGPVDGTFTSTKYYESLHENVFEEVEKPLLSQIRTQDSGLGQPNMAHHQMVVRTQFARLPSKAHEFTRLVHDTVDLFVENVDKCALLRKLWGATANISAVVERLSKQHGYTPDPREYSDPSWETPKTRTRSWRIRTPITTYTYANQHAVKFSLPLPNDDNDFGATVKKCKRCAHESPFNDPNLALKHLRAHASAEASKQGDSVSSSFIKNVDEWKDWIRNDDQALLESTVAGACAILDRAVREARIIYDQLRELANGVRDEHGNLSNLYSFPRKLLEALHRILIFYFAVERSLHYTEEDFNKSKRGGYEADYPYTDLGLEVLTRFSESVKSSLQQARFELCEMVRSQPPVKDPMERMSWGAESISSWLIRRLIVKPLEKGLTVGDMYREYLTTLQFQVNHRPGKRLLRSINLLKEELNILVQVNDWQTQLVKDYICVLDDATYPVVIPSRRALFPYERLLLNSCLENLALTREEYEDQIRRCGPLSESTKQSAEINEEDHGKAILVFTVVTVIFLPLSFVTSYLGMNTSDIRDMDNTQGLFWEIAVPLTVGIMAVMLAIAYNGDEIRDFFSSIYRSLTGKQDRSVLARGISVLQRNRAPRGPADSATTLSTADDAEYVAPRPRLEYYQDTWNKNIVDRSNIREGGGRMFRGLGAKNTSYLEDLVTEQRYTQPSIRKPAFLQDQPQSIPTPAPYTEYSAPVTYGERIPMLAPSPPPPRDRDRIRLLRNHMPSDTVPPTPDPRPTYMRIHKRYILDSVLDDAFLPWENDPTDPSYVLIKQFLTSRETDRLFEESKRMMAGKAPTRFDGRDRLRTDDPWMTAKSGYVWENKKKRRHRERAMRRGPHGRQWEDDDARHYGRR